MFRPSFAPPPLRTSGPADESEDEDDAAERRFHHARTLPRTPFPNMANLAIPSDDDDDEDVVVPGQRPRSSSTPGIRPGIMVPPGSSAFGSPDSGMGPIHRERGPHRPAHPAAQPTKSALRSSRRATIDHFGSFGSPPEGLQSPGPNAVFPAGVVPQLRGQQGQMYFQSPPPTAQGVGMMPNGTPFATMPRSRGMPTPMMVPQPNILPASHAHPHGQSRSRIPMQVPQPPIMTPQIMGQHHQPPPNGMPMPMPMPIYQNGMQHQQPPNTPGFPSGAPQTIPIAVTTPGYNYLPTGVPASAAGGHQWQPGHTQGHERERERERSAKRHRKHRRNRRRDDESESESESEESERSRSDGGRSSDDDHDGRRRSKRRDRSGTNPLPQPPRILPVPEVHANDAIRVDSPPVPGDDDDRPAPPPKPPPNPLPPPPKHVGSSTDGGGSTLADELAAAAEEVKRAKERTELARAKAIQRLEADTYRAAGVPIGGDEENPVVPLIAGVTVPGILPTGNASAAEEERRKKRRKHSRERSNGKRLTTGAPKEVMVFSNVKTRRRKGGHDEEGESTDEDGDDEEDERRDEGHSHNPIAAGIGSLLKRISTRNNKPQDHHHDQNGNGNGNGHGYQNGGTRRPPPPPPPPKPAPKRGALKRPTMPTHNSYDMPEEEGIVPRNAKRMVMGGNNNQPFRSQTISAANGANMIAGGDAGGGTGQYPFVQPRVPGAQIPMQYDPATQEWFDPSNGMWWNPNTRKYYHKRSTVPTVPASKHKKEGSNGGGLISMLKRWTTNTAPDHQPKPITAQLIMPGGIRRKSFQQQPVAMLANHPHAVAAQQQRGGGPRRRTISAGEMSRMGMGDGEGGNGPWYHPSANANRRMTADQMRDGSGRGRGMLPWGQHQMVDANGFPIQAAQSEMHLPRQMMGGAPPHGMVGPVDTIYFSRKRDPYGAFRLDSEHPVAWAGIEAPSAFHWYESGRFESVGKGLGASGMQTGWTRPSTQPLPSVGRGRSGSRLGHASKMLKGLLGKNDYGLKESRLEYARAHTECSDDVLRARTLRDLMRLVTQYRMEGFERNDWMMIYRSKLDEIQFLKFTQHEELGVMLLNTGFAPIIFNNQDPELGDGGDSNGAANNGRNELGHSLMRVREMLRQRRESEAEERSGGGGRGEYGDEGDYDEE